jgi:hypothetical protein
VNNAGSINAYYRETTVSTRDTFEDEEMSSVHCHNAEPELGRRGSSYGLAVRVTVIEDGVVSWNRGGAIYEMSQLPCKWVITRKRCNYEV